MSAANKVIAGDYEGRSVISTLGMASICSSSFSSSDSIYLIKDNVESYEILDGTEKKSAVSAVGRATAGALLLGPVGLLAGVSAKKKGTYLISVVFRDGKQSLLEVDEKIKKAIIIKNY